MWENPEYVQYEREFYWKCDLERKKTESRAGPSTVKVKKEDEAGPSTLYPPRSTGALIHPP